jgi:predicted dienelactone hydrolase
MRYILFFICTWGVFFNVNAQVKLGQRTLSLYDSSRQRPLRVELWYPTADTAHPVDSSYSPFVREQTIRNADLPTAPLPLLLLSHGTGGGRLTLEWLAQGLAKEGFMVAAVDHWGNTFDNKIPIEFLKAWERPLDMSYVLTYLLRTPPLKASLDSTRMGAIGFSYGGYTVLALAGAEVDFPSVLQYYRTRGRKEVAIPELPDISRYLDNDTLDKMARVVPPLFDRRFKAFFAVAPSLGRGFSRKAQFRHIACPVYIVGIGGDRITPPRDHARKYHQLLPAAIYVELAPNVGHYVMLNEAHTALQGEAPLYFKDAPTVDRHQVHLDIIKRSATFFQTVLSRPSAACCK